MVIASVALLLVAGLFPVRADAASTYEQVLQVDEREGTIPSCHFSPAEPQTALGGDGLGGFSDSETSPSRRLDELPISAGHDRDLRCDGCC